LISSVLKGFSSLCLVDVLVSCAPPKLLGGLWKVVVGDTLRLFETTRASLFGEGCISCAEDISAMLIVRGEVKTS
jgi:hypothetical protein